MLDLRCTRHPGYDGTHKPGEVNVGMTTPREFSTADIGSGSCADCWEKFRLVHEGDR